MLTLYKHLEIGEGFGYQGHLYIKSNHQRGRRTDISIRESRTPVYRHFKPSDIVLNKEKVNIYNQYMEVKCDHEIIPFDNDKQCVKCGHIGRP